MPWKESYRMDERVRFISRLLEEGDSMTEVCQEFGISRKTGYKFWNRYLKEGLTALSDQATRTHHCPHKTSADIESLVVDLRQMKPNWGPKKLKARLQELHKGLQFPATSTIGDILERNGLVEPRKRVRKRVYYPTSIVKSEGPNDLWCVDFKGQFKLKNGKYCYPLTVTDHSSRYLLGLDALESTATKPVIHAFERIFTEYGVPNRIRSDNGVPFAARGLMGLSQLSVWWLKQGIKLERIEPGHPEQNGRHERFHLTLKEETTRPPANNMLGQQEVFDRFLTEYNCERPHEALGQRPPKDLYRSSEYKLCPKVLDYPTHDTTTKVYSDGNFHLGRARYYASAALAGEMIGLRQLADKQWSVWYSDYEIGILNTDEKSVRSLEWQS